MLIRPTRRPLQTDTEWRADQDSLSETAAGPTGFIEALPSLLDELAPTAHAQGNSPGDYGNAAPIGQVGTPPLTALEETRLGPVMPGTNFELPISLVNLGGRGLATSLTAYYNSNQWGAYVGPGGTTFVFDPIQSWPSPGFSLGFGRIVYYDPRPLKKGPPPMPFGPLQGAIHQYLCVIDKDGTICRGLSPSGSPFGSPGYNDATDGYDPKKCQEISSNPCFASCVRRKFDEFDKNTPEYDYPSSHCLRWVSDTRKSCKKECKQ